MSLENTNSVALKYKKVCYFIFYFIIETTKPTNKRRKRKGSQAATGQSLSKKGVSPRPTFSLASQVSIYLISIYLSIYLSIHLSVHLSLSTWFWNDKDLLERAVLDDISLELVWDDLISMDDEEVCWKDFWDDIWEDIDDILELDMDEEDILLMDDISLKDDICLSDETSLMDDICFSDDILLIDDFCWNDWFDVWSNEIDWFVDWFENVRLVPDF